MPAVRAVPLDKDAVEHTASSNIDEPELTHVRWHILDINLGYSILSSCRQAQMRFRGAAQRWGVGTGRRGRPATQW